MSSDYANSKHPDLTGQQPVRGGGMNMNVLWMCGHRGTSTGAQYRRIPGVKPLAWKCAACAKKEAA